MNLAFVHEDIYSFPKYSLKFSPSLGSGNTEMILPNHKFNCAVPAENDEASTTEISTDISTALSIFSQANKKCIYLNKGWWTYQFCFNHIFAQVHYPSDEEKAQMNALSPEQRKRKEAENNYIIGSYSELPTSKELAPSSTEIVVGKPSYIKQKWGGGTFCELVNAPRQVTVQYYCMPNVDDHISMVIVRSQTTGSRSKLLQLCSCNLYV